LKTKKTPIISTRGYYDLSNGKKIKKNLYYLYPKKSFQELSGKKELVIMVHGLRNDKSSAIQKFMMTKKRLKQLGYMHPVIGYSYDSNTKGAHLKKSALKALRVGQKIAKENGLNLSKFIIDFKKINPHTKIRLIGHSLGTEVILYTIKKLGSGSKNKGIVESVYFFGSSISSDIINTKKYGRILQKIVRKKIKNYYSPVDEVLKQSNKDGSVKNPLGYLGIKGKTIPKIIQIRVYPKNHRFVSYVAMLKSFP
jgi:triacylglycerol esterase/lipase EstA (alpha/beta hydrolase family)